MRLVHLLVVATFALLAYRPAAADAGLAWQVRYDEAGRLVAQTDPAGRTTRYTYQQASNGRFQSATKSPPEGAQVTWRFDDLERLTEMTDGEGTVDYRYDTHGRLKSVQRHGGPAIVYAYDTLDRIIELRVGDFYRVHYTYDFLGRIEKLDTPAGPISYEYVTGQGQVVRTLPNGLMTVWTHDANGELRQIAHADRRNSTLLAEFTYAHGPDGRIEATKERSGRGEFVRRYDYDTIGRLVHATGPNGSDYRYEYDLVGNRLKETVAGETQQVSAFDWAGRLTSVDGQPAGYDAAGNLTSATIAGTARRYGYNSDGRLAEARSGEDGVQYRYDGDGRLILRKTGQGDTRFIPDPLSTYWQPLVIKERNGARTLVVWDGATPLAVVRNGKAEFLLHDHLGSVRVVSDAQGQISRTLDYDPFGTPDEVAQVSGLVPRFAGLFWDSQAGVYLTLARSYVPWLGSFLQPDPKKHVPTGERVDLSLFAYCTNDPVNYVDSDGENAESLNGDGRVAPEGGKVTGNTEDIDKFIREINIHIEHYRALYRPTAPTLTGADLTAARRYAFREWAQRHHSDLGFLGTGPAFRTIKNVEVRSNLGDLNLDWLATLGQDRLLANRSAYVAGKEFWFAKRQEAPDLSSYLSAYPRSNWRSVRAAELLSAGAVSAEELFLPDRATQSVIDAGRSLDVFFAEKEGKPYTGLGRLTHGAGTSPSEIWWKAFGQDVRSNLLNTSRAKETLAILAESHLANARGTGIAAGLTATLLDLTGGYIGGKPASQSQHKAQLFGAVFFPGVQRLFPLAAPAVGAMSSGRSGGTAVVNAVEGSPRGALLDLASAGLHVAAKRFPGFLQHYQYELPFDSSIQQRERLYALGDVINIVKKVYPWAKLTDSSVKYARDWAPHRVGGVYLGGALASLEGLGPLQGIRRDANNNLVLIGAAGDAVRTPPLRIDDLVTVFRSVYLYGEGPTVTIDPASIDPEHSAMIIRHGEATEGTYVGWVLYQADRLMKAYTLGVDNITQQHVVTRVPGYKDVVDTIYFGGADPEQWQREGHWERFWIVPAEARSFEGPRGQLTLVDVPLKVNTQSMKWENGELVDDPSAASSKGASEFTAWFSGHYDDIAAEQYLTPPPESGINAPVPVFAELRRIAVITAIAETLRDQGVPMPFWMRDYEVTRVPFEKITPGMRVTRANDRVLARIFGGVGLSSDLKIFTTTSDLGDVPAEQRPAIERSMKLARSLEETAAASESLAVAPPLKVERFVHQGEEFRAVALPGAETQALGSCRIDEVDMVVPLSDGRTIELVRSYNSFFDPSGPWGRGWALNLPQLVEISVLVKHERGAAIYATAHEVLTPFNDVYARFQNVRSVAELNGAQLEVPDQDGMFYGLADDRPDFLNGSTQVLILKDGRKWHFTQRGDLVAIEQGGLRAVYERDDKGRVTHIVGLLGGRKDAVIRLEYTPEGHVARATGSAIRASASAGHEVVANYEYDVSGRLVGVASQAGTVGYRYNGPLVTAVTWRDRDKDNSQIAPDEVLRSFQYNARGQLVAETRGASTTQHQLVAGPAGVSLTTTDSAEPTRKEVTRYDVHLRPLESTDVEGTRTQWQYPPDGSTEVTVTTPEKQVIQMTESADGRRRSLRTAEAPAIAADYDGAGRLEKLSEDGVAVLRQRWRPDGQPAQVETDTESAFFEYDEHDLLSSVVVAPPSDSGELTRWRQTKFDQTGRLLGVHDSSGLDVALGYDASGALAVAIQKTADGNYGYKITRDNQGRVRTVESSWGDVEYAYGNEGELQRIVTSRSERSAVIELLSGAVQRVRDFDGEETTLSYYKDGDHAGLLETITWPNGLKMTHDYDEFDRLTEVAVGAERRVAVVYNDRGRIMEYVWKRAAK